MSDSDNKLRTEVDQATQRTTALAVIVIELLQILSRKGVVSGTEFVSEIESYLVSMKNAGQNDAASLVEAVMDVVKERKL